MLLPTRWSAPALACTVLFGFGCGESRPATVGLGAANESKPGSGESDSEDAGTDDSAEPAVDLAPEPGAPAPAA